MIQKKKTKESNNKKILLVDDDTSIRELYKLKLADEGFKVIEACNLSEAMDKAKNSKPDLIFTDILMPQENGLELLRCLSEEDETTDIPVIVLTILSDESNKKKAKTLGAKDYLIKSKIVPDDVVKAAKEAL